MLYKIQKQCNEAGDIRHIQVMQEFGTFALIRTFIENRMGDYVGLEEKVCEKLEYNLP